MQFHKEIKVSTGSYTNGQGEEKKSYCKIGALFINPENGNMSAKLDVLPIPNAEGEIWLSFFDKYDENKQQAGFGSQQAAQQPQVQYSAPPAYNQNVAPESQPNYATQPAPVPQSQPAQGMQPQPTAQQGDMPF